MSANNDYRKARKKEIMDILISNPNQSLFLLKFVPERDLKLILEAIFKKHIIGRFGTTATDKLIYKTMNIAYSHWKHDYEIEKRTNEEKEEVDNE